MRRFSTLPSGRLLSSIFERSSVPVSNSDFMVSQVVVDPTTLKEVPLIYRDKVSLASEHLPTLNYSQNILRIEPQDTSARAPKIPFKAITKDALASLMWLKTFLAVAKKVGVLDTSVVNDAFIGEEKSALGIASSFASAGLKAYKASEKFGKEGTDSPGATVPNFIAIAINYAKMLIDIGNEEQRRIVETKETAKFIYKFTDFYGLPPMGLLHCLAHFFPEPNMAIIDGQGTFLRTREWPVATVVMYIHLYQKLEQMGFMSDKIPFCSDMFSSLIAQSSVSIVMNNNRENLRVSRFAENRRYCLHPVWLLSEHWIPKKWTLDPYDAYLQVIKTIENPFSFTIDNVESWMRNGGVFKGRYKRWNQPAALIFRIGHDPGMNKYPNPGLGLAPGDYGTVSFNERDYVTKVDIDTSAGWFITQ